MKAADDQFRAWKASGKQYQLIAAVIAEWAGGQERGTALPGDYHFTRNLDFAPSQGTIHRAKRFLAAQGLLEAEHGRPYSVA